MANRSVLATAVSDAELVQGALAGSQEAFRELVVRFERRCVQMLHVGPYEREHETIALMRAHAKNSGLRFEGRHHEIYLSDPRRVPAERLKTILRHPVAEA